ncbi:hypothetical protein U6A24_20985 [Aquimarina gracilis]|uniref:Class I lanthipeptide n=1 Tax=Aquimarina gracilis TaxID=874422 RepID=A0ABU6A1E6_9FLAO|nr:hypothetical protein [Aquimarina gracilis]MEB3347963.1 hypothetical protein [Aquimarina gracilis]
MKKKSLKKLKLDKQTISSLETKSIKGGDRRSFVVGTIIICGSLPSRPEICDRFTYTCESCNDC